MKQPSVPNDEQQRIAALHRLNIDSTPNEERFDRYTRLALQIFHVPVALISLVGEEQVLLKSAQGLTESYELDRTMTFCDRTIVQSDILEVPDATKDLRFADNPFVTGSPNIRFYAGMPILSPDGYPVGTFCIYDSKPQQLSPRERDALRELANLVQDEFRLTNMLQTEGRLSAILNTTVDAIITIDDRGTVESFNHAAASIFGYEPEEVISNNISMLMPSPQRQKHDGYLQRFIASQASNVMGKRRKVFGRRKDGSTFPLEVSMSETIVSGRRFFTGVARDITEQIQKQRELENYSQRLKLATRAGNIGVWDLDLMDGSMIWDKRLFEIFNEDPETYIPTLKNWSTTLHPLDKVPAERDLQSAIDNEQDFYTEFRIISPDQTIRHVQAAGTIMRNNTGAARRLIGIVLDITERKEAQNKLRNAKQLYQSIIDATDDIVFIKDRNFKFLVCNNATAKLLGRSKEELVNTIDEDFFPPEAVEQFRADDQRVFDTQKIQEIEELVAYPDGSEVLLNTIKYPLYQDNKLIGLVGIGHDITESKMLNAELEQAKQVAEQANQMKSEFLANMSHELRTPLNAIIGFSELLKDGIIGELTPDQSQYCTEIFDSGAHLLELINELLDLSKIEAGKMDLNLEASLIQDLVQSSLYIIREKAIKLNISLELDCTENIHPCLLDAKVIKQILYNLLSNAIKFTKTGGSVLLTVNILDKQQRADLVSSNPMLTHQGEYMQLSVTDTGTGIAEDDLDKIFQPFEQVDNSLAKQHQGTGLGLSLVRSLVELQGGMITVESTLGEGSTFKVYLPHIPAEEPKHDDPLIIAANQESRVALIIEDDAASAEIIKAQLLNQGITASTVTTCEQALSWLNEFQKPDLITLDLNMPTMSGWEFLQQIQSQFRHYADIPIIIISVSGNDFVHNHIALSVKAILQKPVDQQELHTTLDKLGLYACH